MRVIIAMAVLVAACTPASTPPDVPAAAFRVVKVIDGDTIVVGAEQTKVRLIGINAPEHDECYGPESAEGLEALLDHHDVRLATDVETTDQYGRLLAYVYVNDELINQVMVERGLAIARPYPPNTSLQQQLDAAMEQARELRAGLWEACASGLAGAVEVVAVADNPPGPDEDRLDEETVTLENTSAQPVALDAWILRDGSSTHRYRFPRFTLAAGATVTVHTGCGGSTRGDLFWCADGPVWDNDADIALLLDSSGHIVDVFAYAH